MTNKGWYDQLLALPIASPDMTEEELRKLCVDAFKMHSSFVWTPTEDINYTFTLLEKTSVISLPAGIAYAAMKMADGVYSSSSFHVMMCSADPVVVYRAEGGAIRQATASQTRYSMTAAGSKPAAV